MSIFDNDIIDKIPDSSIRSMVSEYLSDFKLRPLTNYEVKNGVIYFTSSYNEYVVVKKRFPEYFKFDNSWDKAMNIILESYGDIENQDDIRDIKGDIIDVYTNISNCTLNIGSSITFRNNFKNIKIKNPHNFILNIYLRSIKSPEELLEISSNTNRLQCIIPKELYSEIRFNHVKYKDMIKILYKNNIECIVNPMGASFYLDMFLNGLLKDL